MRCNHPPPCQVLYMPSSVPYRIVRSQTLVDCYLSGAVIAVGLSSASRRTTAHRPELAAVIVRHSHSSLLPAQAHRRHSQSPLFVDCCFWPACPCQNVVLFVTPVRCHRCRRGSWRLLSRIKTILMARLRMVVGGRGHACAPL